MKFLLIGFALIVLWIVGTFVANITTGWVHAPLAVGTALIAIGIVVSGSGKGSGERGAGSGKGSGTESRER